MSCDASIPITEPCGTRVAISAVIFPSPQPTSRTRSPLEMEQSEYLLGRCLLESRSPGVFSCIPFSHAFPQAPGSPESEESGDDTPARAAKRLRQRGGALHAIAVFVAPIARRTGRSLHFDLCPVNTLSLNDRERHVQELTLEITAR
jgi:hypothetical protein